MTETTPTETPKRVYWPVKTCGRCGGSGRHSYNQIDGDMCYGCSGTGKVAATKKVAELMGEARMMKRRMMKPTADQLHTDDRIRMHGHADEWALVLDVTRTDEACGRSFVGGKLVHTIYYVIVKTDLGEQKMSGDLVVCRFYRKTEAAANERPLIVAAWESLTKAQRRNVTNPGHEPE